MKAQRHHLGRAVLPFGIKAIEAVLEKLKIFLAIVEAGSRNKAHVIGGQGIGDDEVGLAIVDPPIGQVVVIGVGYICKAARFADEVDRVEG